MIDSLKVIYHDHLVGRLAVGSDRLCRFEYSPFWLAEGFSISPFELPLQNKVFTASSNPFEGGFGVFDDSLPDGWGLLVIDRLLRKQGINPSTLNLLDRLSIVGRNGRGALEFYPDNDWVDMKTLTDLDKLAKEAEAILNNDEYYDGIEEFQYRGGSPGGARPKIFTHFDGKEWLVKFPARNDPADIGKTEFNYSLLAKECGIIMPETRLFNNRYFGTERFDRKIDGSKLHVISMSGMLKADYRIPSIDYLHIFKVAALLTGSTEELWKIYRLMVFNYLIGNKDDHSKNFAFIYDDDQWKFAPAFDLLPSSGFNGFHTTTINDNVAPTERDLLDVAVNSGLDKNQARSIYKSIKEIIRQTNL